MSEINLHNSQRMISDMSAIQNRLRRLESDSGISAGEVPRRVIGLVGPDPEGPMAILCIEVNGTAKSEFLNPHSYQSPADFLLAAEAAHLDIHGEPWPESEMEMLRVRTGVATAGSERQNH